jgi:uncharacterized protein (TIGR03382 family)
MKKSKRIVILFVVVEALLAAIMVFLTLQVRSGALQTTVSPEETIARIGGSIGGVMGALGGFLLVFAWVLRRRGE